MTLHPIEAQNMTSLVQYPSDQSMRPSVIALLVQRSIPIAGMKYFGIFSHFAINQL